MRRIYNVKEHPRATHLPSNLEQADPTLLIGHGQLLVVWRDGHGRDTTQWGVGGWPVAVDRAGGEVH